MTEIIDPNLVTTLEGLESLWDLTPATLMHRVSRNNRKPWMPAKHLLYIGVKYAQRLEQGDARFILSMPTRHGKSLLTSVATPLWILHHHPDWEIILLSYGADLAEKFCMQVRDMLIADDGPEGEHILNASVRSDAARVDGFMTTEGGGMRATGMMGSVYGHGANVLLVDDFYKNPKEAFSQQHRKDVLDNFSIVADSRLAPGGSILINATRWPCAGDDLSGQLLSSEGAGYEEIALPAFAEKDDPLGRKEGEALWPERFNEKRLQMRKGLMGSYFWSAFGQQKPLRSANGIFDETNINVVSSEEIPWQNLKRIRIWDQAGTQEAGDYTCGPLVAEDISSGDFYILDMQREQYSPHKVEKLVLKTAQTDGFNIPIYIEQEPGSSGKSVVDNYQRNVLRGWAVYAVVPTGPKFVRAQPFFAAVEAKRVYVKRAKWNRAFFDECLMFSEDNDHDDQVDSVAHGYNKLFGAVPSAGAWGRGGTNTQRRLNIGETETHSGVVTGVVWGRR